MATTTNLASNFRIVIIAGVVADKLELVDEDSWALAARQSNSNECFWHAFLWSVPRLGSTLSMTHGFPTGVLGAFGVIVGDGQVVSSINPLLTEWIFGLHKLGSGDCLWINLGSESTTVWRSWSSEDRAGTHKSMKESPLQRILSISGPIIAIWAMITLTASTSISYYSALFIGTLYLATIISNLTLSSLWRDQWARFTKDIEKISMLIIAPGDRWAVVSGPRNLVKTLSTGHHTGQIMHVVLVLSAGFLQGATYQDGVIVAGAVLVMSVVARIRAKTFIHRPRIRGVTIKDSRCKSYGRRAELIEELSETANSDAWAYDAGLLTRRYVPHQEKA
jgi:hypothetical protein